MNKIMLIGRLASDVKMGKSGDIKYGKTVIAVNRAGKKDKADFIQCTAFGKLAETIFEYCKKGHRIGIEGRLQASTYEKNGEKRNNYSVIVESIEFLQAKEKSENVNSTPEDSKKNNFIDDDFPFD